MKTTEKPSSQKKARKPIPYAERGIFTVYYLLKYKYITTAEANACMFYGYGCLEELVELFNNIDDEEILSPYLWTQEIIDSLRKLCRKLSAPGIYEKEYKLFNVRCDYYENLNERKEKKQLERKKWENDIIRYKKEKDAILKKLSQSKYGSLLNASKEVFIEKEQFSKRTATIIIHNMSDIRSGMDLLNVYMVNRNEFFRYKNLGRKAFNEICVVCEKYIELLKD
jgi:hypothetical protein